MTSSTSSSSQPSTVSKRRRLSGDSGISGSTTGSSSSSVNEESTTTGTTTTTTGNAIDDTISNEGTNGIMIGSKSQSPRRQDSEGTTTTTSTTTVSTAHSNQSPKQHDEIIAHRNRSVTEAHHRKGIQHLMKKKQPHSQPEGWRVKLYRLNQDGSWDDCGTGRILCIYENSEGVGMVDHDTGSTSSSTTSSSNTNSSSHASSPLHDTTGPLNNSNTDDTNHLGYATLCVHSEIPVTSAASKDNSQRQKESPKVLLRTRILLQETAYQRQGDNIITWYEPFYNANSAHSNHKERMEHKNDEVDGTDALGGTVTGGGGGGGVDLALSFQDNCGCLEIWEQIIAAQGRQVKNVVFAAAAAAQRHHQQQQQQQQQQMTEHNDDEKLQSQHRKFAKQQQQLQGQKSDTSMDYDASVMANVISMGTDSNSAGSGDVTWDVIQHQHYHAAGADNSDIANRTLEQQLYQTMSQHQQHQLFMNDGNIIERFQLPSPPSMQNLDDIADAIASLQQQHHLQQRELLSICITASDCLYYKQLLDIFFTAESNGNFAKLATLAACIKTMLLLNDPTILELTITDEAIFDRACACLEYDPDLREKANHRWFLRERVKFRTVVPMNDAELEQAIHRTFRVQYLRDTLLRPTMDESCLSTLSSLQTFTHADVIKGVTMSSCDPTPYNNNNTSSTAELTAEVSEELRDSYLVRVMRKLGTDLYTLRYLNWMALESPTIQNSDTNDKSNEIVKNEATLNDDKACDQTTTLYLPTIWKQHLSPQDDSMKSSRRRRCDALSFLRELFQMVRSSLQQCDRDDFFAVICTLEIDLLSDRSKCSFVCLDNENLPSAIDSQDYTEPTSTDYKLQRNSPTSPESTNILALLANLLLDPDADMSEKGAALEILAGVAMHDASLIRRHTLDCSRAWKATNLLMSLPEKNEQNQVLMVGPPDDVLSALIFLLSVETDAGVLLQVSEIMRIVLDTDAMGDQTLIYPTFADEADGIVPGIVHNPPHDQHNQPLGGGGGIGPTNSDQAQFLTVFYDFYADWLVAPFQYTLVHPIRRVPDNVFRCPLESPLMKSFRAQHQDGCRESNHLLKLVTFCPVRLSFTVELLSFCVRAHLCRMKSFILKSRVMGNVLQLLKCHPVGVPGDRCLKLAILRFLRAVLSVNDESYHRHIIQHNLFAYVFDAFRENPVGDNLVSSAVVEMCDYINNENIKCLLDYIGRRHLIPKNAQTMSLEDVSSPYVNTITTLRKTYEANIEETQRLLETGQSSPGGSHYFPGGIRFSSSNAPRILSGKALEDQRKFQQKDDEESYFDMDDDEGDGSTTSNTIGIAIDETAIPQDKESDMHRTPRMFSLSEAPLAVYDQFEKIEEK